MQLLKGKNALIFGAKGALGKQVAKEFKSHGANLYLTDINVKGENEETDLGTVRKLDTLDERQIETYFSWFNLEKVVVDIVINCSGTHHSEFKHGEPSSLLSADQFLIPLRNMTASQFLTAKYAAGAMTPNKSGVIIFITSTVARVGAPFTTALTASHAATEGIVRCLASEWGPAGIRVLGVRSGAMPDTPTIRYTFDVIGKSMGMSKDEVFGLVTQHKTTLKKMPTTVDTAKVITFAASDLAGTVSGTIINNSAGEVLD